MLDKHLDILGYEVTDRVTGFKGVVTSISFDLYGCVQALVTPQLNDKGQMQGRGFCCSFSRRAGLGRI
jgi:hypothetical protein